MPSITGWLIVLAIGIAAVALTTAMGRPDLQMLAAGITSAAFAFFAIRGHSGLAGAGASESAIGAATARSASLVWTWGALAILITYVFVIETRWPEWWQFVLGFSLAAAASIGFAIALERDSAAGRVDQSLLKFGRVLVIAQLVGVALALASMFVDGKFPRAVTHPDWAACNIFFFGALAIAAISADALRPTKA
jgi:hypothetical protein